MVWHKGFSGYPSMLPLLSPLHSSAHKAVPAHCCSFFSLPDKQETPAYASEALKLLRFRFSARIAEMEESPLCLGARGERVIKLIIIVLNSWNALNFSRKILVIFPLQICPWQWCSPRLGSREPEESPSLEIFETQLYVVPNNFDQQIRTDYLPFNLNYSAAL